MASNRGTGEIVDVKAWLGVAQRLNYLRNNMDEYE